MNCPNLKSANDRLDGAMSFSAQIITVDDTGFTRVMLHSHTMRRVGTLLLPTRTHTNT